MQLYPHFHWVNWIQMLQPLTLIHWMLLKLPLLLFSGSTKIGEASLLPSSLLLYPPLPRPLLLKRML